LLPSQANLPPVRKKKVKKKVSGYLLRGKNMKTGKKLGDHLLKPEIEFGMRAAVL